jgi:hypothetical protein
MSQRKGPSGPKAVVVTAGAIRRQKIETVGGYPHDVGGIVLPVDTDVVLPPAAPLIVELTDPDPNLYYSARMDFMWVPFADGVGITTLQGRLQRSIDNGLWVEAGSSSVHYVTSTAVFPSGYYSFTLKPKLGSVLGVVDGSSSLRLRMVARCDDPNNTIISPDDGTLTLSLTEYSEYVP